MQFSILEDSGSPHDSEGNPDSPVPSDTDITSSEGSFKDRLVLDPQFHYGSFYLRMGAVGEYLYSYR